METLLSRNIDYFGLKHFGCVIDPNCEDIIMSSWDTLQWGTPMFRLTQKIKAVRVALFQWGGSNAREFIQSISEKRNLLTSLEFECQLDPSNQ